MILNAENNKEKEEEQQQNRLLPIKIIIVLPIQLCMVHVTHIRKIRIVYNLLLKKD